MNEIVADDHLRITNCDDISNDKENTSRPLKEVWRRLPHRNKHNYFNLATDDRTNPGNQLSADCMSVKYFKNQVYDPNEQLFQAPDLVDVEGDAQLL